MFKPSLTISRKASWVLSLTFLYGLLVGFGITSSSLSLLSTDGKSHPGLVLNSPQSVRSDEFIRSTPLTLAVLNDGSGISIFDSQNSYEMAEITNSNGSRLIRWSSPRFLLASSSQAFLSNERAFAAIWWFPLFILLVFLPLFLSKLGVTRQISILTTLLVLLSTSSNWWSSWPSAILAWPVAGAYLALSGLEAVTERRSKREIVCGIIFMILSCAFLLQSAFEYAPWSILVNVFVFTLTVAYIMESSTVLTLGKRYVFSYLFALALLLIAKVALNQSAFSITLATVYPGARRFLEGGSGLSIFSGNLSWALQEQLPAVSNQSELANSNIELLLVVFSFIPLLLIFRKSLGRNLPLIWGTLVLLPFLLWIIAPWPSAVSDFNPLRFMPPDRLVQIIGLPAIIVFGLFASYFRKSRLGNDTLELRFKRGLISLTLIPVFLLIMDSNKQFASLFSAEVIPPKLIWGCAVAAIFSIYCALIVHNAWLAFAPLLITSLLNVYSVNPIVVGLGDLRSSNSSMIIERLTSEDDLIWASDNFWVDALLMSNGAKLASGQQLSGPNAEAYQMIDPSNSSIDSWNRGASYVSFVWVDEQRAEVSSPSPDQIRIAVNPCSSTITSLGIGWIVSSRPLNFECVVSRDEFQWMGISFFVYERI